MCNAFTATVNVVTEAALNEMKYLFFWWYCIVIRMYSQLEQDARTLVLLSLLLAAFPCCHPPPRRPHQAL